MSAGQHPKNCRTWQDQSSVHDRGAGALVTCSASKMANSRWNRRKRTKDEFSEYPITLAQADVSLPRKRPRSLANLFTCSWLDARHEPLTCTAATQSKSPVDCSRHAPIANRLSGQVAYTSPVTYSREPGFWFFLCLARMLIYVLRVRETPKP